MQWTGFCKLISNLDCRRFSNYKNAFLIICSKYKNKIGIRMDRNGFLHSSVKILCVPGLSFQIVERNPKKILISL